MFKHSHLTLVEYKPEDGEVVKWQCCDGEVTIYVYRVMYGYRLRAGYTSDTWGADTDWCLGAIDLNGQLFAATVCKLVDLLMHNYNAEPTRELFYDIPMCSSIKPMFLDAEFLAKIFLVIPEREVIS